MFKHVHPYSTAAATGRRQLVACIQGFPTP